MVFAVLKQQPALYEELSAPSLFHTYAPEIYRTPGVRAHLHVQGYRIMKGFGITNSHDDGSAPGCVPPTTEAFAEAGDEVRREVELQVG